MTSMSRLERAARIDAARGAARAGLRGYQIGQESERARAERRRRARSALHARYFASTSRVTTLPALS
jgi:hypothetical protein